MVLYCAVPKCKNSKHTPGILMHRFPSDERIKAVWIERIQNTYVKKFKRKNIESMRVCSAHFKSEDYQRRLSGKIVLKKDAEPTIFNFYKKSKSSKESSPQTHITRESTSKEVENACIDYKDAAMEVEKSSDLEMNEQNNSSTNFANLPDVILLKVFNHLNFEDRCRAGCVCRRWYNVSKSPAVWKKVDVKVKTPYHLLKFLLLLPSTVTNLSIFCLSLDIHHPLWFPDIMFRLHERCPHLKSLILENVFLSQRFCNAGFTTQHVLNLLETSNFDSYTPEVTSRRVTPMCAKECCSNKINRNKFVPENRPQELCILSLRYSRSYMCHLSSRLSQFIPRIKILDLTYSVSIKDAVIPFFARLTHLEELYLSGCPITNSGIENLLKHLKKLKVLDLEGSRGVNDDTFEILQAYGQSLEKLYLGNTPIESLKRPVVIDKVFPQLQILCLKNTPIDDWYIMNLIEIFPSLQCVDVSFCSIDAIFSEENEHVFHTIKKKLICNNEGYYLPPCHHFKEQYIHCD